jgi:diadenylate cyclase
MNALNVPDPGSDEKIIQSRVEALKSRALSLYQDLASLAQCSYLGGILQKLYEIREELNQVEQGLLMHHLTCCIAPKINIPAAVITAVSNLVTKRHGAIIIIERDQNVEQFLQGGVSLNAFISAAILENIFYPGSPLHDGAVLIRNSQIIKANCVLPLASDDREFMKLNLGTRHRAALGLSRVSDALIIVASEERGWISVALNGQFYPNLGAFVIHERLGGQTL